MYQLANEQVSIRVSPVGAQLCSLYCAATDTEHLWQPGAETWPHSSMLLFPNPGRISRGRTVIGGKVYPASMHGFANDMPFTLLEQTDSKLVLELRDDENTCRSYPYSFRLQVTFTLEGDTVVQTFRVYNDGKEPMYYCLGAHPGFYCPIVLGEKAEDYVLSFDRPQNLLRNELEEHTRLLTGKTLPYLQGETDIALHEHFFDNGPMLFEGMDAKTVTLRSKASGRFVEMGIAGFPYLCLWGVPGKMSLIAVEPWIGTSDRTDTDHIWERKPGIQKVEPGAYGTHQLTFRMG